MHVIDIDRFIADGFAKVEAVVPREVGDAARALLWQRIGLSPQDPSAWTQPVVWTADMTGEGPFGQIMAAERLHAALDLVTGPGGWQPRRALGNIPVRFPRVPPADDRGWHIDASTPRSDGTWGVSSRPHALLLLVLLSDVGPDDAPTRVRAGSQRDMAAALADPQSLTGEAPAGEGPDAQVLDPMAIGLRFEQVGADRPEALVTGRPGDVYIAHPFLVHAAQEHRGTEPRFMAQMPLFLARPFDPAGDTPLARAARA
ncbi:mitomycin antibiotics/polyketide fumonisin biosynthesis protein [Nonomuraea zeae]|uniref:Mitomycin antibiotics/polyketide fumonisin biosynthesis protein n=1 Tax=Nonomuraea zeae TaxID=1642303 RepID=A0A5S4GB20_9ACTN|nr:mitomycin antibiotics/polyketide fumonisin biosynthesis protein [Nonomuraea zeae]TMR30205.1 mitomycin antibiotics/polyketide fumonisin biosynthesis protein [Nonomuraea zeae]